MVGTTMTKLIVAFLYLIGTLTYSTPALTDFNDWEQKDKRLWKSYVALNVVDTFQTFDLIEKQKEPAWQDLNETNPLLGSHPKKGELVIVKLLVNGLAFKLLDNHPESRTVALALMNAMYINTVCSNHEVGLRMTYKFKR